MHRYSAYCLNFSSSLALEECVAPFGENDDFTIVRKPLSPPELSPTTIHRRGIMAKTAIDNDGSLWLHWDNVATFRASEGTLLEVHAFTEDVDILSLFTVSEALGMILFQRGYFLLHASAIKAGDEAWLFMGHPGAGKSTTSAAFVKAGSQLLSDDLTAISFDDQQRPFIRPAYPQLKIWQKSVEGLGYALSELTPVSEGVNKFALSPRDNFPTAPVPLTRLYFLHHNADLPDLEKMNPTEYPVETLRHFPMPNQFLTPAVLRQYFAQSIACSNTAKAYVKKRPDGFIKLEDWVRQSLEIS